ncbi:hypothetical protein FACS1894191_8020 [Clostridia bacterium]|nr:hypothetical protein FACS1894191_8020 [Clostridia bacterium]
MNNTANDTRARVTERKIGKTTYIVSSRFSGGKERDLVSTIARLIEHEGTSPGKTPNLTKIQ